MSNRPDRTNQSPRGFRWKIAWRCLEQYRDGTRMARTWTIYQYRVDMPKGSEVRALAKRYPECEFRARRIGEPNLTIPIISLALLALYVGARFVTWMVK